MAYSPTAIIPDSEEKLKKLKDILNRHLNCNEKYIDIVQNSEYKLMSMSKCTPYLGLYYGDDNLVKYFSSKDLKITKDEQKRNAVYYFDNKRRLLLLEKYSTINKKVLRWVFFYYYEDHTEIIGYSPNEGVILEVYSIDYQNGELDSFIESGVRNLDLDSYVEYKFNEKPNRVIKKIHSLWRDGTPRNTITELARIH